MLFSFATIFEMIYYDSQFPLVWSLLLYSHKNLIFLKLCQQVSYYSRIILIKSVTYYSQNYSGIICLSLDLYNIIYNIIFRFEVLVAKHMLCLLFYMHLKHLNSQMSIHDYLWTYLVCVEQLKKENPSLMAMKLMLLILDLKLMSTTIVSICVSGQYITHHY